MGTAYFFYLIDFFLNFTLSTPKCNNQTLIKASIKDRLKIGDVCVCVGGGGGWVGGVGGCVCK